MDLRQAFGQRPLYLALSAGLRQRQSPPLDGGSGNAAWRDRLGAGKDDGGAAEKRTVRKRSTDVYSSRCPGLG